MGLKEQAALDCAAIVQDPTGFAVSITVTNPAGVSATLMGLTNDISHSIDPDTGTAVTGRRIEAVLPIAALLASGLCATTDDLPVGIPDGAGKPWLVRFGDVYGAPRLYKVRESAPDRGLPVVRCSLESYRA